MKIMFLAPSYWPALDGVSVVTQYLAEGLARKHEVRVLATRGEFAGKDEHGNVAIERIRAVRNIYLCTFQGEKQIARDRIMEYQPDVLIFVGIQSWFYDWFVRELNRLPGKKMLMTHGASCLGEYRVWPKLKKVRPRRQILADLIEVNFERYWKNYQRALPKGMGRFDLVSYLYEGDKLYQWMCEAGLKNSMILENATQEAFFDRKAYLVDETKEITFINVSNYEKLKNQDVIIRVYGELNLQNTRLLLIGSRKNPYYEQLVEMKQKFEQDAAFQGKIDIRVGIRREEVLELYKEADVYVGASSTEVMSISICEAASAGLLILSTDVGHASKVPGVLLFDGVKELKELMLRACQEPELRRQNGRMANAYAEEKYRIQKKVDLLEEKLVGLVE